MEKEMSRVVDLEIATSKNFDKIKFEEKFKIQAKKFGLAGRELIEKKRIDENVEFGFPDGDMLVPDIRIETTAKMKQRMYDEVFKEAMRRYIPALTNFKALVRAAETIEEQEAREAELAQLANQKPREPKRKIVREKEDFEILPKAPYKEVHQSEFNTKLINANKLKKEYIELKQKLCAELLCHIDEILRTAVMQHDEFKLALEQNDIITLFDIVKESATGKGPKKRRRQPAMPWGALAPVIVKR